VNTFWGRLLTEMFRTQFILLKFANLWVNSQRMNWGRVSGTFTEDPDAEYRKENTCNAGIFCRTKPHFRVMRNGLQTFGRCPSFPDLFPLVDPVARCSGTIYRSSLPLFCGLSVYPQEGKMVNFTRISCIRIGRSSVHSSRNIHIRRKRVILPGAIRITVYSSGAPPDLERRMDLAPVMIICTNGNGRSNLRTRPLFLMKFAR